MRLGFTGSRAGMTTDQWSTVEDLMRILYRGKGPHEWHDGDCVGADEQAHGIIEKLKKEGRDIVTHGHPCNLDQWRANRDYDRLHSIKPPLVRNRVMVSQTQAFIATPKEYDEVLIGSGTWATIRYCQRVKRHTFIVWPDGTSLEKDKLLEGTLFDGT